MKAIVFNGSSVAPAEVGRPSPGPGQVLVQVKAAALNRVDLVMSKGGAHGASGGVGVPLGLEWAGDVVEVGQGAQGWKIGDRVMGSGPGAFGDFVLGYAPLMYAIPSQLSYTEAAGLPVGLQTMHDAVATNGDFQQGQSILVQGASSGMGLIGMQVAKVLGAGLVIGSSSSAERRARLSSFGADLAIDTTSSDWVQKVTEATHGKGVDLLVDLVAGPLVTPGMSATRIGGRMVNVGRVGGESGGFDFDLHSMRRIHYIGVSFRTRTPAEVVDVVTRARKALEPVLARNELKVPIDQVFPRSRVVDALSRMAQNQHFGKIVLSNE